MYMLLFIWLLLYTCLYCAFLLAAVQGLNAVLCVSHWWHQQDEALRFYLIAGGPV